MEVHNQAVARVATAVRSFFSRKEPYRIFHGSTNSTRPRHPGRVVDISPLSNVLKVDTKAHTALVEPNVPMDRLVASTLKYGLVPPVVMEFPGITAGGGYAGTAGESSSFKHGFFDKTINRVEMVLGNGDVKELSADSNRDLFRGAAGAVGTLGITTLLEIKLVQARKYVKTTYHRLHSVRDTINLIKEEASNMENDYVDGILYSKDHGVVVVGKMTDEEPQRVQTFSFPSDPWYYLHVQEKTHIADGPVTEFIPLAEYLFRYDRGGFWVGRSAFDYFKFPFNKYTRWFLDDFLHTRMLYKALHASHQSATYIVQDLALPYATAEDFVDYTASTFNIWPLWLCPLLESPPPTFHPHVSRGGASPSAPVPMLNIGLWGPGPPDARACTLLNRDLEHRLHNDFGGMKWLYAHTHYSEDEFWNVYDRGAYDALREKYHASSLPSVYDKVKVDTQAGIREQKGAWSPWLLSLWPLGGLWGLKKSIESGEYLPRCPPWR